MGILRRCLRCPYARSLRPSWRGVGQSDMPAGLAGTDRRVGSCTSRRLSMTSRACCRTTASSSNAPSTSALSRRKQALDWGFHRAEPDGRLVWRGTCASHSPTTATRKWTSIFPSANMAIATTATSSVSRKMRQSLRIINQCLEKMPARPGKGSGPQDRAAAARRHEGVNGGVDPPLQTLHGGISRAAR